MKLIPTNNYIAVELGNQEASSFGFHTETKAEALSLRARIVSEVNKTPVWWWREEPRYKSRAVPSLLQSQMKVVAMNDVNMEAPFTKGDFVHVSMGYETGDDMYSDGGLFFVPISAVVAYERDGQVLAAPGNALVRGVNIDPIEIKGLRDKRPAVGKIISFAPCLARRGIGVFDGDIKDGTLVAFDRRVAIPLKQPIFNDDIYCLLDYHIRCEVIENG